MLQKFALPIAVFIIILVALTFGETIGREALNWLEYLSGLVFHNFADVFQALRDYVARNTNKVLAALVLTIPVSYWLFKNKGQALENRSNPRKVAIVLAVFLGWLGAHRFYLGQIGLGIFYLILFYIFAPLVVVISLIDAVRYLFMTDEDFAVRSKA